MNAKKNWITISAVPKHIYSFIEFGKEEMSFHFEREREREKNSRRRFVNEYAHIFSVVSNEQYAMSRKKMGEKIVWIENMQNWLIFLSFHRRHQRRRQECVSFRFDAVWFGMIFVWFTPFNHLLKMESINWIRRLPWNWYGTLHRMCRS